MRNSLLLYMILPLSHLFPSFSLFPLEKNVGREGAPSSFLTSSHPSSLRTKEQKKEEEEETLGKILTLSLTPPVSKGVKNPHISPKKENFIQKCISNSFIPPHLTCYKFDSKSLTITVEFLPGAENDLKNDTGSFFHVRETRQAAFFFPSYYM